jgi:hypothetical protein
MQLNSLTVSGEGRVSALLGGANVALLFDAGTVVNTPGWESAGWSIGAARIELIEAAGLQISLRPPGYALTAPARLVVRPSRVGWSGYELRPDIDLTIKEFRGDLVSLRSALQVHIPSLQLTGSAQLTGNLAGGPFAVEFAAEQLITRPLLASLFGDVAPIYDLDSGRIRSKGVLRVDTTSADVDGAISVTLADLSAHYEDIAIDGINADLAVDIDAGAWRIGPDRVEVRLVDVGFPITDLVANVSLTSEHLGLSDLTGRTLGGDVVVVAMDYDMEAGSSDFVLQAMGIRLADVLALEGETITGNGMLDGELPLQIRDDEIRVKDGRFSARAPGGSLSYGGAEEAAQSLNQVGVGFAIAALGDFRFEVLDVGVNYEPNGDLLLEIHLEGHNPQFETGRPIHYNLNISENIPVLLQSLQLSDELGRQLEKRLQQ